VTKWLIERSESTIPLGPTTEVLTVDVKPPQEATSKNPTEEDTKTEK
jgi:hypothetical protein